MGILGALVTLVVGNQMTEGAVKSPLPERPRYFIPIPSVMRDTGVVLTPAGTEFNLTLLIDGLQVEDLMALLEEALQNGGQVVVKSRNGTLMTGAVLDLGDIVAWAITHGYLDDPERFTDKGQPVN